MKPRPDGGKAAEEENPSLSESSSEKKIEVVMTMIR